MKAWVNVITTFDAAHHLPHYKGKCANVHGHTYKVEVGLCGYVDPRTGMVMDMTQLKSHVEAVILQLDHKDLNKVIKNPTAENIAAFLYAELTEKLSGAGIRIKVWETPDAYVEF